MGFAFGWADSHSASYLSAIGTRASKKVGRFSLAPRMHIMNQKVVNRHHTPGTSGTRPSRRPKAELRQWSLCPQASTKDTASGRKTCRPLSFEWPKSDELHGLTDFDRLYGYRLYDNPDDPPSHQNYHVVFFACSSVFHNFFHPAMSAARGLKTVGVVKVQTSSEVHPSHRKQVVYFISQQPSLPSPKLRKESLHHPSPMCPLTYRPSPSFTHIRRNFPGFSKQNGVSRAWSESRARAVLFPPAAQSGNRSPKSPQGFPASTTWVGATVWSIERISCPKHILNI